MGENENDVKTGMGQDGDSKGTPAEAKNTDSPMIPKARFDEINNRKNELEARLAEIEADQKLRIEQQLEEQGKYKELTETLRAELAEAKIRANKSDELEGTLEKLLAAQLEALPEQSRKLVPEKLSIKDRLDYIAENRELLVKPAPPGTGAGKQGGKPPEGKPDITAEESAMAKKFGLTEEEYAKHNY